MEFKSLDLDKNGTLTVEEVNDVLGWYLAETVLLSPSDKAAVLDQLQQHEAWINLLEGRQKKDPAHRGTSLKLTSPKNEITNLYMGLRHDGRVYYRDQLAHFKKELESDRRESGFFSMRIPTAMEALQLAELTKVWRDLDQVDSHVGVIQKQFDRWRHSHNFPPPPPPQLLQNGDDLKKAQDQMEVIKGRVKIDNEEMKELVLNGLDLLAQSPTGARLLQELAEGGLLSQFTIVLSPAASGAEAPSHFAHYKRNTKELEINREAMEAAMGDGEDLSGDFAVMLGHEFYHVLRYRLDGNDAFLTSGEETIAYGIMSLIYFELGTETFLYGTSFLIPPKNLYSSVFQVYSGLYGCGLDPSVFLKNESGFKDPEWQERIENGWKKRFPDDDPDMLTLDFSLPDETIEFVPFVMGLSQRNGTGKSILASVPEIPKSQEGPDTPEEARAIRDAIPFGHNLDDYEVQQATLTLEGRPDLRDIDYEHLKKLIAQEIDWSKE